MEGGFGELLAGERVWVGFAIVLSLSLPDGFPYGEDGDAKKLPRASKHSCIFEVMDQDMFWILFRVFSQNKKPRLRAHDKQDPKKRTPICRLHREFVTMRKRWGRQLLRVDR